MCEAPQSTFNPVTGSVYHGINLLILGVDFAGVPQRISAPGNLPAGSLEGMAGPRG